MRISVIAIEVTATKGILAAEHSDRHTLFSLLECSGNKKCIVKSAVNLVFLE